MKIIKLYLFILYLIFPIIAYSQSSRNEFFSKLIGVVYSDPKEIGINDCIITYLIDPENNSYGISACKIDKNFIVMFEQNVDTLNNMIKWKVLDVLIAPKHGYFDHWCCKMLDTDNFNRESIAFIKKDIFFRNKIISIYRANRETKHFVRMDEESCYKINTCRSGMIRY